MSSKTETIDHTVDSYGMVPGAEEFPLMVVITFVYPCNAQCPHCPYTNSNIRNNYRDTPYMPEEVFKKIADESGQYGALLRISGGGEPMLHPKATELLVYAKSKGCKIGLITNGSKFDEANSRALLNAGVDLIEFSVDACDEETYGVVRKGLKWNVLQENIRRMLELRDALNSPTKVIASAVNQKIVDIDAVEDYWRQEVGVDNFIKRKFLTWGNSTDLDYERSADPSAYLDTQTVPCPFPFERLFIDSRGNVMICVYDISVDMPIGNVLQTSLKEIWHGDDFREYREKHLALKGRELPLCAECPDWRYRSWKHNYWKVKSEAEKNRAEKLQEKDVHDDFMSVTVK